MERNDGRQPDRAEVWIEARKDADGKLTNEEEVIKKMVSIYNFKVNRAS